MSRLFTLRSDQRGAATIEMAIALPTLVLFIWGIFQVGVAFQAKAGMQHALGEGARLATLYPKPDDSVIVSRMSDKVFGMNVGTFSTPTVTTPTGCATCRVLTVSYTVTPNFLLFNGPPITITRTKQVYTTAT